MKINIKTWNYLPKKETHTWQFILIPTIAILGSKREEFDGFVMPPYVAINFEWLFWDVEIMIRWESEITDN